MATKLERVQFLNRVRRKDEEYIRLPFDLADWLVEQATALEGIENVGAVAEALRRDRPWSLDSILERLIAEVEHLHRDHSCDHQGYEDALAAKAAAGEARAALAALDAPAEVEGKEKTNA